MLEGKLPVASSFSSFSRQAPNSSNVVIMKVEKDVELLAELAVMGRGAYSCRWHHQSMLYVVFLEHASGSHGGG
mgnify:CR=1 FL=1